MKLHKGIAYFATYQAARAQAEALGLTRIIQYDLGWAIQYRVSGPYWPEAHDTTTD